MVLTHESPLTTITTTIITIVISIVGIVANCLSLSYYIKRQNKGLGNRLLMLLNSCDLVVCSVYVPRAILELAGRSREVVFIVTNIIYLISFDCTGIATSLMSVTRTIKVCRPFFAIKGAWTAASFLLYFICSFAREFTYDYVVTIKRIENAETLNNYHLLIFSLGTAINVVAVFISTMITVHWLLNKNKVEGNVSENNKRATVTIIILSTVFCLLNAMLISAAIVDLYSNLGVIIEDTSLSYYCNLTWRAIICLNSTVNPMIYLARKEEMRRHVSEIWRALRDNLRTRPQEYYVDFAMRSPDYHHSTENNVHFAMRSPCEIYLPDQQSSGFLT